MDRINYARVVTGGLLTECSVVAPSLSLEQRHFRRLAQQSFGHAAQQIVFEEYVYATCSL